MATAAAIRLSSVGRATPSTPQPRPKMQIAFPAMFSRFIPRETSMDSFELPFARKTAAFAW